MTTMIRTRFFFLCLWVFVLPFALLGQTCSQLLSQMEDQYEAGSLLSIPEKMARCFHRAGGGGFTKEERIRAQRLTILSHIFTDDMERSEDSMEDLLHMDPEHVFSDATDPKEVFYLYDKFRTTPIYRFRFYLMGNYSVVNSLHSYGVENTESNSEKMTGNVLGGLGASVEKEFFNFMELVAGVRGASRSFSLRNDLYQYSYYELTETQLLVDVPLEVRFFLAPNNRRATFQPYLQTGWIPSFLLSSSLSGVRQGGGVVNLGTLSFLSEGKRHLFTHSFSFGAGFKYRLKNRRNFLIFDVSYARGNTNLVRQKNRYLGNQDLYFRLGYVDNNFSLNALQMSVGVVFSVYDPKKLRKYRE